jgi:UTP-glucose-1-phosphate uridylyltransferase
MTDAKSTAEGEGANKDKVAVTASGSAGLGEAIWPALGVGSDRYFSLLYPDQIPRREC